MKKVPFIYSMTGVSLMAIAASAISVPAFAQETGDAAVEATEIVVTARRKDERLQDVPLTVNAVSADDLNKLSIKRFEDIATAVPGLNMAPNSNGLGATASVRGVNYDVFASGNNGTIEFYLNDAPYSAGALFQAMYDVGQVELLRGPQGTLRGRASPSGSMTITTHRVNLSEIGGYVSGTATDIGGINANGALNIPIINDVLAIRVAALLDENENNRVRSVNNGSKPYSRTASERISVRFEPTGNLRLNFMYQKLVQRMKRFDQVMSTGLITASTPGYYGTTTVIGANDRLSVEDAPRNIRQQFDSMNWQAEWAFSGQKLNYVGSFLRQKIDSYDVSVEAPADGGDFFGPSYASFLQGYGQQGHTESRQYSHELRLSSEEPLFGKLDYIVGAYLGTLNPPTNLSRPTPVLFGPNTPAVTGFINQTPITRFGNSKEKSVFGNLTLHLGDATELSGGGRYIYYENTGGLTVSGFPVAAAAENKHFNAVVYSASLKHRINDDLMVYASTGSSWRPGINVTGDFNPTRTTLENSFLLLAPERSKSYELGLKSSFLNKRLKLNVTAFHQDFTNYPWRSPSGVFYRDTSRGPAVLNQFNFVGAVPVKVDGVEFESNFQFSRNWNLGGTFSYSKSKIKNGVVPCNDYSPVDGIPDSNGYIPTLGDIAASGDVLTACRVNYRASLAPLWAATLQSEYSHPLSDQMDGYLRGMLQLYGASQNDPTNSLDDYKGYSLLNLFVGIRDPKGAWELSAYGKNITKTKRILNHSSTPLTTSYNIGAAGFSGTTAYYGITTTAPREFGVSLRYAFGSR